MTASEPAEQKKLFPNRKKLLVAMAAVGAAVLLAGLLVWFSAPKNELLTEMPTQQSRLRFLGPLRQPVSDAWQKFRRTWLKPSAPVSIDYFVPLSTDAFGRGWGKPVLTNVSGASIWVLPPQVPTALLGRPGQDGPGGSGTTIEGSWIQTSVQNRTILSRAFLNSGGSHEFEVLVQSSAKVHQYFNNTRFTVATPTTNELFGAKLVIPPGYTVAILGPREDSALSNRFGIIFTVK